MSKFQPPENPGGPNRKFTAAITPVEAPAEEPVLEAPLGAIPPAANLATPYITPAELISAPTGIDWSSIPVRGASAADSEAEILNICWRATGVMDEKAFQTLRATIDSESVEGPDWRFTIRGNGVARVQLSNWPVLSVVSVQTALAANFPRTWTTVDVGKYDMDYASLNLHSSNVPGGSPVGPAAILLAGGLVGWNLGRNGYRVWAQYINGWPNAGLTIAASAGTSILHVDDVTGFAVTGGRIYDGTLTEQFQCQSASATNGPGTLTLSAPLVNAHAQGTRVSAMPPNLQQAGIYLAVAEALIRGATAIGGPGARAVYHGQDPEFMTKKACGILAAFARII